MEGFINLQGLSWFLIGLVAGVGSMLFLCNHAPITDDEKRALIRRWQDEFDAEARR